MFCRDNDTVRHCRWGVDFNGRTLYNRLRRRLRVAEVDERCELRGHIGLEGGFCGIAVCLHAAFAGAEGGFERGAGRAECGRLADFLRFDIAVVAECVADGGDDGLVSLLDWCWECTCPRR